MSVRLCIGLQHPPHAHLVLVPGVQRYRKEYDLDPLVKDYEEIDTAPNYKRATVGFSVRHREL